MEIGGGGEDWGRERVEEVRTSFRESCPSGRSSGSRDVCIGG